MRLLLEVFEMAIVQLQTRTPEVHRKLEGDRQFILQRSQRFSEYVQDLGAGELEF